MPDEPPIRVGLLLDGFTVPAWTRAMLELLAGSDFAKIALVVLNAADDSRSERGRLARLRRAWPSLLYVLYGKLDRRRFAKRGRPDALAPADVRDLLAGVPVVEVRPRRTRFSDYFAPQYVEAIRTHKPDVLVRLGFRILRGEILTAARYGVWSFHHGDNRINRGGPPGFWEVFEQHPTTGSILQVLSEDLDAGQVLYRSWSATDPLSVRQNLNQVLWKSLHFLPRVLRRLHRLGGEAFQATVAEENRAPSFYSRPLYRQPTNRQLAGPLVRLAGRGLRRKVASRLRFDQWGLMYRLGHGPATSFWRFRPITPPRDRFWADPHVIRREGKWFVFVEEFIYRAGKAHVSVITIDERGNHGPARKVLERPHHLSYPFTLELGDECFLLPESPGRRGVEVFRAAEFPDRWEHHATLLPELEPADATLLEHGGRWWLFTSLAAGTGCTTWDELFLFYAADPFSRDWTPHPQNPIVSDVRRARPAGKIFTHNGRLYRPAQDCSRDYGYALRIHEILALSTTEYAEREIAHVEPRWNSAIRGVHHFSYERGLTVIDVKRSRATAWAP